MGRLLGYESPIMKACNALADTVWYSILWLVCSLPVVTVGAATTALCRVTIHKRCQEAKGTAVFFRAFKESFVPATLSWLLLAAGFTALGFCLYGALQIQLRPLQVLLSVLVLTLLHILLLLGIYVFPFIAHYTRLMGPATTGSYLRSAMQILAYNPFRALPLELVMAVPVLLFLFLPVIFLYLVPFWLCFWPGMLLQWMASRTYKQFGEYELEAAEKEEK